MRSYTCPELTIDKSRCREQREAERGREGARRERREGEEGEEGEERGERRAEQSRAERRNHATTVVDNATGATRCDQTHKRALAAE
eukprot:COSAG03_NODE_545_length_7019_cov_13.821795_10_plen_86_part_00